MLFVLLYHYGYHIGVILIALLIIGALADAFSTYRE